MPNVVSSSLKSATYNDKTSTLIIVFRNGRRYLYPGVPRAMYEELLVAPSKGSYFDDHIKDRYPFSRG